MAVKDAVTTRYIRQNEIFADVFNFFIYDGEQVIRPDSLEELDTRQIEMPYGARVGARHPVQKTRDVIKSVTAMTDQRNAYLLLAIENQSHIHYAMPVKNLVYDALQYARQVEKTVAFHKLSGDYKGIGSDEYLSGFMKNDRLIPVVTLTMYFDSKEWDGPMSMHEMFEEQDERILSLISDYKINLITPADLKDSDFQKFKTTLKEVLSFIKYAHNKDKLKALVAANKGFHHLGRNEIDVLNTCVGAKLGTHQREEGMNVCLAIEEMKKEAAEEAAQAAVSKTLLNAVENLIKKMGWSAEQSMDILDIYDNDRRQLLELLNAQ